MPPRGFVIDLGKDAQRAVTTANGDDRGHIIPTQKLIEIGDSARVRSRQISISLERFVGQEDIVPAISQRLYAAPDGVQIYGKTGRRNDGNFVAGSDRTRSIEHIEGRRR